MADVVKTETLVDGDKVTVMHFTNVSDGTGEAAVTKVDASALAGAPSGLRIEQCWWTTKGMGVNVLWDATSDALALGLAADENGYLDFRSFGGLKTTASGASGDIKFTTVGATASNTYSITLQVRKVGV